MGRITAGLDFIRRTEGHETEVYGLCIPLMLKSDGTKFWSKQLVGLFGWIQKEQRHFEFYQFWLNKIACG